LGKHLSKEPINGSREVHEWCKAGDGMDSLLVPVRDEAVLPVAHPTAAVRDRPAAVQGGGSSELGSDRLGLRKVG